MKPNEKTNKILLHIVVVVVVVRMEVANVPGCDIVEASSNSSGAITFSLDCYHWGKLLTLLSPQLWVKWYHYFPATRIAFNLKSQIRKYPYLTNPSARAGYDTRSIFKRSLTGLNAEFSFP